ncbi:MAG: glycosyltransferase family 39 protein, partial [Caldimicrobium sp.]
MKRKYWIDYLFSVGGLFIFVLFVGKFYYLWDLKLPLSYDESYYWDWSRNLDWGYFSKPPMVAWLIYLSTSLFGTNELAVRFPALLCQTGSLILLYVLVFRYFGEVIARSFLFTLAFVPIFLLYNFIMTIDPPLLFFWSLSFYGLVEFLKRPSLFWSIFTGIALGAALLTKQTSIMFVLLSALYLFLFERPYLSQRKTYLIFLIAFLMYLPNLYWNFTHGLVLLKHSEEHFQRFFPDAEYYLKFWMGLFLLYGPFFIPLFFYLGFYFLSRLRTFLSLLHHKIKIETTFDLFSLKIINLSFFFSFLPLLIFLFFSLFVEFNHNWLMPFFLLSY